VVLSTSHGLAQNPFGRSARLLFSRTAQNRQYDTVPDAFSVGPVRPGVRPQTRTYWIVSTRRCSNRMQPCYFDVMRVTNGIDYRVSNLRALLASIPPGEPICIVVHGSFIIWESFVEQSDATDAWLKKAAPGRPLHTIFFTWPSEAPTSYIPVYDVNVLGRRAAHHGSYLARLMYALPVCNPLSLIGHSHGTRLISSALHQYTMLNAQRKMQSGGQPQCHRIRAIYAAAAIDHHWLNAGQRYQWAMHSVEVLVNLRNIYDLPLNYYQFRKPFGERALAESGFSQQDYYLLGANAQKVIEYDVSRSVGHNHWWPFYYEHDEIAQVIAPYVFFTDSSAVAP